eukprot:CAMPEP_0202875042 /NCGR_PEP_ID=MMETSP1391-20130828/26497_1 /ASSEMBLY_ACC=CAM_ASM_000867 /TAXON_ID=1034604 /ORGANISM="Chlamydomonas leiostraca, Strain SAG 11-49" /LENGTH=69 /DNA_ID=CAMNT_0049556629 /DNA_START=79 /DNA_END=285 /DNA_ORIENTATION=-
MTTPPPVAMGFASGHVMQQQPSGPAPATGCDGFGAAGPMTSLQVRGGSATPAPGHVSDGAPSARSSHGG